MTSTARWIAPLACLLLLAAASPAEARFRFDDGEIEGRPYDYGFDYFLNVYTYRPRLLFRWAWDDGWENRALGYTISAGSLTSEDLFVDQRARVRLPFSDWLTGEYQYVESEDYDGRIRLSEVQVLFRFLRPEYKPPLLAVPGHTPRPDGLFFGGTGILDRFKEFADIGFAAGYRNEWVGVRFDLIRPDWFFSDKAEGMGEYETDPLTLRAQGWVRLLDGALRLHGWINDDLPLELRLPERDGLRFRYRQLRGGGRVAWDIKTGLRFGAVAWAERTRKDRQEPLDPDPLATEDTEREALRLYLDLEKDVEPALASSSLPADTWIFGMFAHRLDERIGRPLLPPEQQREVVRRGEGYGRVGYLLGLPEFSEQVGYGIRLELTAGFLSIRDVKPQTGKHRVSERFLGKLGTAMEFHFAHGAGLALLQFTWELHEAGFGGGNAQVQLTF